MKRHIQLNSPISWNQYDDASTSIGVQITSGELSNICCELTLLMGSLVESLTIIGTNNRKFILMRGTGNSHISSDYTRIALHQHDLDNSLGYLLKWYRDGIAEVNHIDIDLAGEPPSGKNCTLILFAESFRPPLTADEATQLIQESE